MPTLSAVRSSTTLFRYAALMAGLLVIDQWTKISATHPIYNPGYFLGSFEGASPFYRVFCTLALLGLSIFIMSLIQLLNWRQHPQLIISLAILETGLIGNGIDKLRFGRVCDFIPLSLFSPILYLNLADLYQWIGGTAVLILIWKNPAKLWPKENLRNQLLTFPRSQLKIISVLLFIVSVVATAGFLLIVAYLRSNELIFNFNEVLICFLLFLIFILMILFIFGLFWTHRIYGPFRAIERFLEPEPHHEIRVRATDENEIVNAIISRLQTLKKDKL